MRQEPSHSLVFRLVPALAGILLAVAGSTRAQDPTPDAAPRAAETPPPTVAIIAGTVHPVSGAAIENGVVLVRGDRIVAVGKASEVEIPEGAQQLTFPQGHVYPGLVDALTDAYTDRTQRSDATTDAGSVLADVLRPADDPRDDLISWGITTAYIAPQTQAVWRGLGALVRPVAGGFATFADQTPGTHLRLSAGPGPSHPLQRQAAADAVDALLKTLPAYEKAFADHQKALEKYQKDFADYLAFHQKKKDAGGEATPAGAGPATRPTEGEGRPSRTRPGGTGGPPGGERGGQRGGERGGGERGGERRPGRPTGGEGTQGPGEGAAPAAQPPAGGNGEKPPERPKWPKEPPRDPAKDMLLRVQQGEVALRVEAHRRDELRAALALPRDSAIQVILEQAYGGAELALEIADAGVPCILTDVGATLPAAYREHEGFDATALPAQLHGKGAAVAIASGSAERARWLPLMAAAAAGAGMDPGAALRAITLTPAEILGVGREVGSLEAGKLADLIVCDRPLFASDCRLLRVISGGQTAFEAK